MSRDDEAGLSAADHALGNPQARVTLLEYGDYECPACIQAAPLVRHLLDSNDGRMRFVFRHFPLVEVHPNPDRAMSDGGQSLYPDQFGRLVREARTIAEAIGRSISAPRGTVAAAQG